MRIINELQLDFKDVLILPRRSTLSSRNDVSLLRTFTFLNSGRTWTGIPIMVSNMDTTGTFDMAKVLCKMQIITCIHKFYELEQWKDFLLGLADDDFNYVVVSSGITENDLIKLDAILALDNRLHWICMDAANANTNMFIETIKIIRAKYLTHNIIAGNIVMPDMCEELLLSGADINKIGIGSGSACTTRIVAGIGRPQLSTIIDCAEHAHKLNGHVASDGGCTTAGDIVKAFAGGGDFIMLGGMLAGHDESGGITIEKDGIMYKEFYGMASATAMNKYYGGGALYKAPEGKTVLIPYRGAVINTINMILGGIRSACTYVNARELCELSENTTFIRVSQQSNEIYGKN